MKPTLSNAFTVGSATSGPLASGPASHHGRGEDRRMHGNGVEDESSLFGLMLAPMQADLREAEFGFSLELNPIQAIDAVNALLSVCGPGVQFLTSMEQSSWRDGKTPAKLAIMLQRLGIVPLEICSNDQVVLDSDGLQSLAAIAQPLRLLVLAVEGPIERPDVAATNQAIEAGRSPLIAELRAVAALEVLGDRSLVLHTREREVAVNIVAQNFRHYLAALRDKPAESFAAPELNQVDALLHVSGAITVRPIETTVQGASIDVGVNTSLDRFSRPANLSLIYDVPTNSWHAE